MLATSNPCRWAAWQGHPEDSNPKLTQLPADEQVMRGQELLSMLQTAAHHKIEKQPPADLDSVLTCAQDSEVDTGVTMIVKHTFIELISTPHRSGRRRALTDSALDDDCYGSCNDSSTTGSAASGARTPLAELSDTSLSDTEELVPPSLPGDLKQIQQEWNEPSNAVGGFDAHDPNAYNTSSQMTWCSNGGCWWDQSFGQWPGAEMQQSFCVDQLADAVPTVATDGSQFLDAASAFCNPVDRVLHTIDEVPETPKTTVMLRNLPTSFTRSKFLELLEDEGFEGSFDFVYLPTDFGSGCILGYAFVNFLSPSDAARCWQNFEGFSEWGTQSEKICEMTWGHPHQGLQAHVERYQNSPVMHDSVPDEWKPAVFVDGMRVRFPPPTRKIKAPQMKTKSKSKAERR